MGEGQRGKDSTAPVIIVGGATGLIYAVVNAMGRVNVDYISISTVAKLSCDFTVPQRWKPAPRQLHDGM